MPPIRHLSRAPIVEAVFDFRVRENPALKISDLKSVAPDLADEFPVVEERTEQRLTFVVNPAQPVPPRLDNLGVLGVLFKSADGLTQAQFRRDGFTVHRLAPYTSWAELEPVILRLWSRYVAVVSPRAVTRLAMRFINRVRLPNGDFQLPDYLAAAPTVPDGLPDDIGGFLTRLTIVDEKRRLACNVVQTIERGAGKANTLLLDIDAFSSEDMEPTSPLIWQRLQVIRDFKNEVFFAYLTERTMEGFQ